MTETEQNKIHIIFDWDETLAIKNYLQIYIALKTIFERTSLEQKDFSDILGDLPLPEFEKRENLVEIKGDYAEKVKEKLGQLFYHHSKNAKDIIAESIRTDGTDMPMVKEI